MEQFIQAFISRDGIGRRINQMIQAAKGECKGREVQGDRTDDRAEGKGQEQHFQIWKGMVCPGWDSVCTHLCNMGTILNLQNQF